MPFPALILGLFCALFMARGASGQEGPKTIAMPVPPVQSDSVDTLPATPPALLSAASRAATAPTAPDDDASKPTQKRKWTLPPVEIEEKNGEKNP